MVEFINLTENHLTKGFEKKYKKMFLDFMEEYNTINVWRKFKELPEADQQNTDLVKAMRHFDEVNLHRLSKVLMHLK